MIMTILLILILWAAVKTANLHFPVAVEQNQQLISRAQHLAKWKHSIEQMPDGFGKIQANRQWMLEVEKLITASETEYAPTHSSNIVQLYQLRKY